MTTLSERSLHARARRGAARAIAPALLGLLIAGAASSQEPETVFARTGPYLGGSLFGATYLEAEEALEDEDASSTLRFDVDDTLGFAIVGGFRAAERLAVEVEFQRLLETDVSVDGSGEFAEFDAWSLTAALRVFLLTGRAQPFLRVGAGFMRAELEDSLGLSPSETESGMVTRVGGGIDFYLNEAVVLFGDVDYRYTGAGDLEDLDYLSYGGGLMYRF